MNVNRSSNRNAPNSSVVGQLYGIRGSTWFQVVKGIRIGVTEMKGFPFPVYTLYLKISTRASKLAFTDSCV